MYTIGIDFGTKSGRAVLVRAEYGKELASAIYEYENGVIDERLPLEEEEVELGTDWALQDPRDYLQTCYETIPEVIERADIDPGEVVGLGIDFTACTMLPVDEEGDPLCLLDDLKNRPHAWVKLWKHHAAQPQAIRLNELARKRGEDFLTRYGGKISSEWMIPKIMQTLEEDEEIYERANRFMEAADWVIMKLTGEEKRNISTAGYKAMWSKDEDYPDREFFRELHPKLEDVVKDKLSREIYELGERAGNLTEEMASRLKLPREVAVAVANVDSFVSVPAVTVREPTKMVMVMGTSICHMVIDRERKFVEGMTGCVRDGILPGFYGYEAGQSAVGDIFAWFVENCLPEDYEKAAAKRGVSIHDYLEEKASRLKPGESGLLALDWWNGNRSILVDADLTGLLLGMSLDTRPEEIYRALIEATAFGTKKIIKAFMGSGVEIVELYACGGLPYKNEMLMQIYADVADLPIKVAASEQTPAFGAAMHGAVAAGSERGGHDDIFTASERMAGLKEREYHPDPEAVEIYSDLFAEYERLHDYFGRGENDIMKRLKGIKQRYE